MAPTHPTPTASPGIHRLSRVFLTLLAIVLLPRPVLGQVPEPARGWNAPRVLQLVRGAREVRHSTARDPDFQSYSSQARGYVHFFLDREDTGERILVKTDQIALEVYWAAPDRYRQRIVGLRDEKSLPTNIHYHLDHLVVVQDDFGDLIRIGDGDEVAAVLHPVAPSSETFYDFLLSDSVTLTLPGAQDPVRVYEIQVRPKSFDIPAFVGSVFLDRATSAIVRMSFTFTPASYVDPYLDHIQISLENGLWLGKYWLPYRQQLEIRREVPFLDIPAGSIIKGWFEIRDYEINPSLPMALFRGPTITALPEAQRRAFPFERGLHDYLDTEGLSPPPEMKEIRQMAVSMARDHFLTGLGGFRLFLPQPIVSSSLRFNRAEGVFLGGGFSWGIKPSLGLTAHGGVSLGRERPSLTVGLTGGEHHPERQVSAFLSQPRDLGPVQGISGLLNTLSALTLDEDYRDLFFASGIRASQSWTPGPGWSMALEARVEEHRPGRDEVSSDSLSPRFRAVIPMERGSWRSLELRAASPTPWETVSLQGSALLGRFGDRTFGDLQGGVSALYSSFATGTDVEARLQGGVLVGEAPLQSRYFLGGRETVPGYGFRTRSGDAYWLFRLEGARDLLSPWVRLRVFGAAGGTRYGDPDPPSWRAEPPPAVLLSAGAGVALGWDVLHLDLARGLRKGGDWELMLSVNRVFWPWL